MLASFKQFSKEITECEKEIIDKINLYEDSSKKLIKLKAIAQESCNGKIYNLGGPESLTWKEILDLKVALRLEHIGML